MRSALSRARSPADTASVPCQSASGASPVSDTTRAGPSSRPSSLFRTKPLGSAMSSAILSRAGWPVSARESSAWPGAPSMRWTARRALASPPVREVAPATENATGSPSTGAASRIASIVSWWRTTATGGCRSCNGFIGCDAAEDFVSGSRATAMSSALSRAISTRPRSNARGSTARVRFVATRNSPSASARRSSLRCMSKGTVPSMVPTRAAMPGPESVRVASPASQSLPARVCTAAKATTISTTRLRATVPSIFRLFCSAPMAQKA